MAQRTQADLGLSKQWNEIQKEIKSYCGKAFTDALEPYGRRALKEIDAYSSYESDTENLDDSLMFGIYKKGKYQEWLNRFTGEATIKGSLRDAKSAPKPYIVRGKGVSIKTRYGSDINVNHGDKLIGRQESLKALKAYENKTSGGYVLLSEMVIVAEMYYRYFLENKGGYNWIRGFVEFEQDYSGRVRKYWEEVQKKMRQTQAQAKNFKVV